MSYNTDNLRTAGKITVYTSLIGVLVFAVVFVFNLGSQDIKQVVADSDSATTSITVLNTPPQWTASSTEVIESSTSTPTNAGSVVSWQAIGSDSNAEPYYLIVCSSSATPTPHAGSAPTCGTGTTTQWAVSPSTASGALATAATTTLDSWQEVNVWFGWICDDNATNPRCNNMYTQGTNATNSSPFEVNHRPDFKFIWDDSPKMPDEVVTFTSTSTDSDISGIQDRVKLIVCAIAGFNTVTDTCTGTLLGSTTLPALLNATATYQIQIPTQDSIYGAFAYIIDSHGFEATTTQGTNSILTVSNMAPTVGTSTIIINGSAPMILVNEASTTQNFTLQFAVTDWNSCINTSSTSEITSYALSLYRSGSGVGSTTCNATSTFNGNNCYPSNVPSTTWNIQCVANEASCTGIGDREKVWDCTFPLWYIADPTDGTATSTQYSTGDWRAQVMAVDDQNASSTYTEGGFPVEVNSLLAFALNKLSIDYGSLEPGQKTDPIIATTSISATGNVGLDKDVQGESMCTTYTASTHCPNSASSTINAQEQVFATSSVAYAQGTPISSTTPLLIDLNVNKSTSTTTPAQKNSYWGINVPIGITYAGEYRGQNTFTARTSHQSQW